MAIQEAKQQHPDMLVTKAVVIRETESPTEELQQKAEVNICCYKNSVLFKDYFKHLTGTEPMLRLKVFCWKVNQMITKHRTSTERPPSCKANPKKCKTIINSWEMTAERNKATRHQNEIQNNYKGDNR